MVDIGNARIKAGVYERGRILHRWSGPSTLIGVGQCVNKFKSMGTLQVVGMVSVVPALTVRLVRTMKAVLKRPVVVISPSNSREMRVIYRPVAHLGADRYVNAVGAAARYGTPVIVVDVGTAVTIDAVAPGPKFVGGVILPGPQLMQKGLKDGTARLPSVTLDGKKDVFGNSTSEAIRGGIVGVLVGGVEHMINRMKHRMGRKTKVVFTGGGSRWLMRHGRFEGKWDPDLTLKAVWWLVAKGNCSGK